MPAPPTPTPAATHSKVDLLIIGAGPAGLMAANWAVSLGCRSVRVVDKRNTKIFTGQADGLQCRTLEVLHSFGMAQDIVRQSNHMLEVCFWNPVDGTLRRTGRIPDTIPGISRWQQVVLHQGRIERAFLDRIHAQSHGEVQVERAKLPERLDVDTDLVESTHPDVYPVRVQVRQLSEDEATPSQMGKSTPNGLFRSALAPDDTPELLSSSSSSVSGTKAGAVGSRQVIHAKYVIGCDGAHSWTRKQMGIDMAGEQTDYIWGVLDAVPVTDFPDIRMRCAIHSANDGSVMIIPREDGLVRFYIQISSTSDGAADAATKVDRHNITWQRILKAAQTIIKPYRLEISERDLHWWTAYQIGQRVASGFSLHDRVFIAGDACHTHSPKAGQGMNVSMMDTYNLVWKVAKVLQRQSPRSILPTYQAERRRVAQELIAFDHRFSRLFSGKPQAAEDAAREAGVDLAEFRNVFAKGNRFASGTAVEYGPSLLVGRGGDATELGDGTDVVGPGALSRPELSAEGCGESRIVVGQRLNTAQVVCVADARPWQLVDWLPSDGRWRLLLFCGNLVDAAQRPRIEAFARYLETQLLPRYTPARHDVDSVIDCLTISSTPRTACELSDYPAILHPLTTKWHRPGSASAAAGDVGEARAKSQDYWKIFCDDESYHAGHGRAYEKYGIDAQRGAVVVARPDGYVSLLVALDDVDRIDAFFDKCMLPAEMHLPFASRDKPSGAVDGAETKGVPPVPSKEAGEVAQAL
ncbi:uncharacterized protein PFL1_04307 [Pseudozyma flocculosa PF-1]|uniref:Related to phenol 2-monooxygenase n=2 Tax=Pseudozyma flocculosa TaxID=84751 RepID=A0A5C3FBI6_9BASI|nr:uncharacterized protein PFL1_04307 [Pseudozyma flocculosa PF-1]EPQ27980.1 hypothetical protein PFL1_04307 [Pseudozyma flocculosa PF-1]SPO41630.1 related to phenol 2-monooxygenase [Pseudozyma flocculosa]